jgi:lipoate-protein ligase A
VKRSFPDRQSLSTAVSRAILLRVSAGELPETLRLHRPGASVAFGRRDVASRGYLEAVRAARAGGFEAVERLAGGRAAVFHENTLAFARAVSDRDPPARTYQRFSEIASVIEGALRRLGVDARTGEVPGEYCPGGYSVNAGGRRKIMGVGQRLIARAAHVGGVVVIGDSERVRDILVPVYAALGLDWNTATVGSVEDEIGSVSFGRVEEAILEEFSARYEIVEAQLDDATLALAHKLEPHHRAPATDAGA